MSESEPQFLDVGPGEVVPARRIAYRADPAPADGIGLFWLPGYKSDMASTKATELAAFARAKGYGCTRFDYSGHGVSSGAFEDGTIGAWLEEAEAVFRRLTEGRQIIVGSSMGGYIALLLLRRLMTMHPEEAARIVGLVLIAPAWDMTEELMWKQFNLKARRELQDTGVFRQPSEYGEPYAITRALIEEGRSHLMAKKPFDPGDLSSSSRADSIQPCRLAMFARCWGCCRAAGSNWSRFPTASTGCHGRRTYRSFSTK